MRKALFGVVAVAALAFAVPQAWAKTLTVDKDKVQCPRADFTSIQAAITASLPGDTIKVCPDLYTESVNVNKPALTVIGASSANIDCTILTAADPTKDSIVTDGTASFTLANNNITLSGFVAQGSAFGIQTSASFSGYRVNNNIVQNNVNGINFNADGPTPSQSRVDHNCLRANSNSGLQSEVGNLVNALVDHNSTFRNGNAGLDFSGAGQRQYVTVTGNTAVADAFVGLAMDNSIGSSVDHNNVTGAPRVFVGGAGILIGGADNNLAVTYNNVHGGLGRGIHVNVNQFFPVFATPNVGLNISYNTVTVPLNGIEAQPGTVNLSLWSNNDSSENGFDGILLGANNTNNRILSNNADKNGRDGIHSALASGNTFEDNHMFLNVEFDARDDNRPANTWTSNHCVTDFPAGTICGQ
jgi:parallel beta-helix repeat protein